jgi:DNA-directed RNA polymerase subunit RPC12/RpoP
MSDSARDLLVRGIAAAKAGEKQEARFFLEWVLRSDADRDQQTHAWHYLSQITDDPAARRDCLENVLALEPSHPEARRALAILDGRLDPAHVIDPNRPSTAEPADTHPADAKLFICQQCGGKLAFSPDRQRLTCTYCNRQMTLYQAIQDGAMVDEQDFAVALATARGHSRPVATLSLSCRSCGAAFMLAPQVLSLTCPYCTSAYVVNAAETRTLTPPGAIIPFAVDHDKAAKALDAWLHDNFRRKQAQTAPPAALYLPAWTFDVGGEVQWRAFATESQHEAFTQSARSGSYPILYHDVLVPATHTLPPALTSALHDYPLDGLVPYDAGYLADWPAQTYEISLAAASLVARKRVWQDARQKVTTRASVELGYIRDLTLSSAAMMIESYKLILLPVWIARYRLDNRDHTALINGQTASVQADQPRRGLLSWLDHLFQSQIPPTH